MIFTKSQVAVLAGGCVESTATIRTLIVNRRWELENDVAAWGQYVDELRWRSGQWGLLGTSAAVQTLAACDGSSPNPDSQAIIEPTRLLLPFDLTEMHTILEPKREKGDFEDLMRLAFIAEAHALGVRVSRDHRPPIVTSILDYAKQRDYWDTDSAVPGSHPSAGDAFITALVLYALRNFEDPPGEFRRYRRWLAERLSTDPLVRSQPHRVALIGLALQTVQSDPGQPEAVTVGLQRCEQELLDWRAREYTIVVDRPAFEGYSLPRGNDYTFINAEVAAALFFLRQRAPKQARRFILQVTDRVHQNIQTHKGFQGQPGMQATVDQLWAARLLSEVIRNHAEPGDILVPRFGSLPWLPGSVIGVALVICVVLTLLTQELKTGGVAALITLILTAAFGYFYGRR